MCELEKDARKYLALPPYNNYYNIDAFDSYAYRQMVNKYGEEAVKQIIARLKNTNAN